MSTLLGEARVRLRPDAAGFASEADRSITPAFKKLAATATGLLAGAAAVSFAKSTLDIGKTYQNTLNNLKAVSGASQTQMNAVGKTAKALGSDLTLTSTSAADAATAMTELAKGGLSVDSAMAAAKGTLQLASAAGISAAEAATIQSSALNAYSLDASQAGHVSDVLANAANAAAGEITDFAQGMSQASAVAAATGISLEDTAATLGILANNGIKGSDAGTLLKSALLALQSPSKPAQKAMDALSLSAYDASGNFVGLSEIFGELSAAQKAMTPEAYAAATSTLFGSDAARLAGIAGKEGAEGFDAMAAAMGRQGAAADVASAKAQGVGGAIEAFKSQVETFQIDLFERAAPNIEKLVRFAAEHFQGFGDGLLDGADKAIGFIIRLKDEGVRDFQALVTYLEPLTSSFGYLFDTLSDGEGSTSAVMGILKTGRGVIASTADVLEPLVVTAGAAVRYFADLPGPMKLVIGAFLALKAASAFNLLGGLAGRGGAVGGVASSMTTMGTSVKGFAQTVRANMSLADDSVGRVSRTMGGLSAGIQQTFPGATRSVGLFRAEVSSAATQARMLARYNISQIGGIPSRSTGDVAAFGAAARVAARTGVTALRSAAGGLVGFLGGPFGVSLIAATALVGALSSAHRKGAEQIDTWSAALLDGGDAASKANAEMQHITDVTKTGLGGLHSWGDAWDRVTALTNGTSDAQKKAAAEAKKTYDALSPLGKAQQDVTRETNDLNSAIGEYGVGSSQATKAAGNLRFAQAELKSAQEDVATATRTATAALNEHMSTELASTNADVAASMAKTALSQEIGDFRTNLADSTLSTLDHTQATDEMAQSAIATANSLAAQAAAHSTATSEEGKQTEADAALLGSLQDTAAQLGTATPQAITDLIASLSASAASASLTAGMMTGLGLSVVGIPDDKSVIINAPTAEQKQRLVDLGYTVETLPNGQVKVTVDTATAETQLFNFVNKQRSISIQARATLPDLNGAASGSGRSGLATGGPVVGPGTGTSDSIAAYLSDGEYVIKARSVAKYGAGFLDDVNAGRFATGGLVGAATSATSPIAVLESGKPAPVSHAAPSGRSGRSGDIIVNMTIDPSQGHARDQMEVVAFELRRLKRGGRI